jgi:hypothetical protein
MKHGRKSFGPKKKKKRDFIHFIKKSKNKSKH